MNGKIYVYFNRAKFEKEGIKKYYVGQTSRTLIARSKKDGSGYVKDDNNKSKFANAIRKWGWEAFESTILVEGIQTQEELNRLEIYYIKVYDSFNNGYNSTLGGDGVTGAKNVGMKNKVYTDEHRRKLSESHKGIQAGKNHPMYGKHHSEETKRKISEKKSGKNHHMYGKHLSEETRKKISIAHTGMKSSPEAIEKNRLKAIGNKYAKRSKVHCVELNLDFDSIQDAIRYMESEYNTKCLNISAVCRGLRKHSGMVKIDEQEIKLTWIYKKNDCADND